MHHQAGRSLRVRSASKRSWKRWMETQGVDLLAAVRAGDGFVKARANCRDCKDEAACRAWFLERSGEPAEFCPNAAFFTSLKSEK